MLIDHLGTFYDVLLFCPGFGLFLLFICGSFHFGCKSFARDIDFLLICGLFSPSLVIIDKQHFLILMKSAPSLFKIL